MTEKILVFLMSAFIVISFVATAICIFLGSIYLLAWFLRLWWGY